MFGHKQPIEDGLIYPRARTPLKVKKKKKLTS